MLPSGIWAAAGVLMGFQVTSFAWRVSREVEVGQEGDLTWLPPADILNLASMVVAMLGVFVLPILELGSLGFANKSFGLAVLLYVGYPFALAGHYEMYNNKTPRSFAYFPMQERVAIGFVLIMVVTYVCLAFTR